MIRINLLPGKKRARKAIGFDFYLLVGSVVLSLAIVAGVFAKNLKDIENMRNEAGMIKAQSSALQNIYKEFIELEREKKELTRRIAAVDKIKEGRAVAPRILYDLPLLMRDNLWFKKVTKNEANFELEGRSVDNESVSDFVERLSKLPYMRNVELKSVEDVSEGNITVKKFIVQGSVAQ